MKPIRFIACILAICFFSACSDMAGEKTPGVDAIENTDADAMEAPVVHPQGAKIDPVCEMERDSTWTNFSVYKTDTIWFCGEGCKQAFDARPAKYIPEG